MFLKNLSTICPTQKYDVLKKDYVDNFSFPKFKFAHGLLNKTTYIRQPTMQESYFFTTHLKITNIKISYCVYDYNIIYLPFFERNTPI